MGRKNLLENIVKFNNKYRPGSRRDKQKKIYLRKSIFPKFMKVYKVQSLWMLRINS